VSDAKWAVDSEAVLEGWVQCPVVLIMARIAHVVRAKAAEQGSRATVLAFPVDLSFAVCFAISLTGSNLLQEAILAEEIFRLGVLLLLVCHLLLAIDQSAEVRLLAPITLVERASVISELLGLAKVDIAFFGQTFIVQEALLFGVDESLLFDGLLEAKEGSKLSGDGARNSLELDLGLAGWALHEGEGDAQARPLVLEKVHDTASVEHVTASETGTRLSSKFSRVADATELVCVDTTLVVGISASWVQAGQTFALVLNTLARVTALEGLCADGNQGLFVDNNVISCVDHHRSFFDFIRCRKTEFRDFNHDSVVRVAPH